MSSPKELRLLRDECARLRSSLQAKIVEVVRRVTHPTQAAPPPIRTAQHYMRQCSVPQSSSQTTRASNCVVRSHLPLAMAPSRSQRLRLLPLASHTSTALSRTRSAPALRTRSAHAPTRPALAPLHPTHHSSSAGFTHLHSLLSLRVMRARRRTRRGWRTP